MQIAIDRPKQSATEMHTYLTSKQRTLPYSTLWIHNLSQIITLDCDTIKVMPPNIIIASASSVLTSVPH